MAIPTLAASARMTVSVLSCAWSPMLISVPARGRASLLCGDLLGLLSANCDGLGLLLDGCGLVGAFPAADRGRAAGLGGGEEGIEGLGDVGALRVALDD